MLDNVLPILKNYADFYNSALEEFQKKQKKIHEMYTEEYAIEEDKKASEEYNKELVNTQDNYIEELNQVFNKTRLELLEAVSLDVPDEFIKKYEVLKDISLSESEFKGIAEKYKDNYVAVKLLSGIAEKNNIRFKIISVDDKIVELDSLLSTCVDFIKKYKGANKYYPHELLLRGEIIDQVAYIIKSNVKNE